MRRWSETSWSRANERDRLQAHEGSALDAPARDGHPDVRGLRGSERPSRDLRRPRPEDRFRQRCRVHDPAVGLPVHPVPRLVAVHLDGLGPRRRPRGAGRARHLARARTNARRGRHRRRDSDGRRGRLWNGPFFDVERHRARPGFPLHLLRQRGLWQYRPPGIRRHSPCRKDHHEPGTWRLCGLQEESVFDLGGARAHLCRDGHRL